ncbi:hypothetical protein Tco_0474249 [Tanacetum coccineum]
MDLESAQNNALAKLPLLKQGDYDTWRLRIESYIQLQDYALWEIIEDGNSFKPVARTTTNADGTSTSTIPGTVTAEEKIQKKNALKAQSILMMTLPSEHLLTFNQYKDAKTLFEAIKVRFGGNKATKKTQKTLLKQIMHVMVWRNKSDLGSISFDDLYNNFKVIEQEVKRSVISSSNSSSQNVAFVSTPSSTYDVNTSNVHRTGKNIIINGSDTAGYDKTKGMLCDQIVALKRDVSFNESDINALKIHIVRLKKEKESNQIKIDNFENASKSLDKLIGYDTKHVLNNVKKGIGQRKVRPVWNNAMRTNHQNFSNSRSNFAPTAVLTKSGLVSISTARQSSSRAAALIGTAMPIKTAAPKPFVNVVKSRPNAFQKSHSPSKRSFYQHTTLKNRNLNNRVNIVKVNSVNTAKGKSVISAIGEQEINVVKSKACWVWRPKIKVLDHVSKNNGSYI